MELYPIYDENVQISSNIWYSISGLGESPFMRVGHTIVHIKSSISNDENDKGKLYVIGGANPSGSFNDVYVFDLNSLSWDKFEDLANFENGRYEHSCFSLNNSHIYLFAGSNENEIFNDLIMFDINEKNMQKIVNNGSNGPSARTLHNGCTYKNQLIVYGGGLNGKTPVNDQNLYIYNAVNNKWISINCRKNESSQIPANRHGHVMINLNDEYIYLHGGMNEDTLFDDLWLLDMKNLSWKQIDVDRSNSYPCERAAHGGISINNDLFIFGGISKSGSALDDLWKFDTVKNQWTLIEIFGYKPPSRLDFAYCKASFKNKVKKSTNEDKELNELDKRINNETESTSSTQQPNENDSSDCEEILSNFLVIHGGMDTEGNIFDDLYLIKLD